MCYNWSYRKVTKSLSNFFIFITCIQGYQLIATNIHLTPITPRCVQFLLQVLKKKIFFYVWRQCVRSCVFCVQAATQLRFIFKFIQIVSLQFAQDIYLNTFSNIYSNLQQQNNLYKTILTKKVSQWFLPLLYTSFQ